MPTEHLSFLYGFVHVPSCLYFYFDIRLTLRRARHRIRDDQSVNQGRTLPYLFKINGLPEQTKLPVIAGLLQNGPARRGVGKHEKDVFLVF